MVNFLQRAWKLLTGASEEVAVSEQHHPQHHPDEINAALQRLIEKFHWLDQHDYLWGSCSPVKSSRSFGGCAYVEGRKQAIKVNRRISVVGMDDDMSYTTMCVLLQGEPCLVLHFGSSFVVRVINAVDGEQANFECNNYEQYAQLPPYLRYIMRDIAVHIAREINKRESEEYRKAQKAAQAMKEYS